MSYFLKYAIFNLLFLVIAYTISSNIGFLNIDKSTWCTYILFFSSTLLIHFFLKDKNGDKQAAFIRKFMLATTFKLFLFLGIIVVYFLLYKSQAKHFIVWFLFHYAAFTAFETAMLVNSSKKTN